MSLAGSAYFYPLHSSISPFLSYQAWPSLDEYQQYLDACSPSIRNATSQALTVVTQDNQQTKFVDRYAARIYLRGEIQTREQNWHDFFQLITWHAFPETKKTINARHYLAADLRFREQASTSQRSDTENLLSLFDECGAILVSDDPSLLDLVREFDWKTLFYDRREDVLRQVECIVFGHALLEKLFNPYIGITANAILQDVSSDYFQLSPQQKLQHIDTAVSARIEDKNGNSALRKPKNLSPLPLLGLPGYWYGNEKAIFFENLDYFRPGRRKQ